MRARQGLRGFSLLELVIALSLIAVLASIALDRMLVYFEYAENVAMETNLAILKRALAMRTAGYLIQGRYDRIAQLATENPMDWLAEPPANYIGEVDYPREADLPRGVWYFDRATRELAYRPKAKRTFEPGPDGNSEVRFRAIVKLAGVPGVAASEDRGLTEVSELTLRPVRPYRWAAQPP